MVAASMSNPASSVGVPGSLTRPSGQLNRSSRLGGVGFLGVVFSFDSAIFSSCMLWGLGSIRVNSVIVRVSSTVWDVIGCGRSRVWAMTRKLSHPVPSAMACLFRLRVLVRC